MEVKDRDYGYGLAVKLAREQLAKTDIAAQCQRSGAILLPDQKVVAVDFLDQTFHISFPDGKVTQRDKEASVHENILVLHYFLKARGTPLTGDVITFKELPEGSGYYPTFYARAIKPLVNRFGGKPEEMVEVAEKLNSRRAGYGDASVSIDAFKNVPITFVLWQGDEEFPPEGSILFDRPISDYLPTEDITAICQVITGRLVKAASEASP